MGLMTQAVVDTPPRSQKRIWPSFSMHKGSHMREPDHYRKTCRSGMSRQNVVLPQLAPHGRTWISIGGRLTRQLVWFAEKTASRSTSMLPHGGTERQMTPTQWRTFTVTGKVRSQRGASKIVYKNPSGCKSKCRQRGYLTTKERVSPAQVEAKKPMQASTSKSCRKPEAGPMNVAQARPKSQDCKVEPKKVPRKSVGMPLVGADSD